jgi:predicted nucleic acid-binding protein
MMAARRTPEKPAEGGLLLLDACCLINLYGTGHIEDVLEILPYSVATSERVADCEVLTIRGTVQPDGSTERVTLSPRSLETAGHLSILPVASEQEIDELARFAANLDDGEASVCALAVVHGGGVATDDRRALRILRHTQVPVVQTPELLFAWAQRSQASGTVVRDALRAINDRARFYPRKDAPCFHWWAGHFK